MVVHRGHARGGRRAGRDAARRGRRHAHVSASGGRGAGDAGFRAALAAVAHRHRRLPGVRPRPRTHLAFRTQAGTGRPRFRTRQPRNQCHHRPPPQSHPLPLRRLRRSRRDVALRWLPGSRRHSRGPDRRVVRRRRRWCDADSPIRRFDYTDGQLTAVVKGGGGSTRYTYDADGRMLSWTDGNGNRMVNTYDTEGRVVRQNGTGGILDSTFDYRSNADCPGIVTVVTDSTGAATIHGFDSDLRLRDVVDATGSRTHTDYNARREPLRIVGPDGATTSYLYTADGDVARITRPDGHVVAVDYAGPANLRRSTTPTAPCRGRNGTSGETWLPSSMHQVAAPGTATTRPEA
ncbi:hypothetical protein ROP_35270 [Rhodococcus opacus B4]|uniref:RHS repeat protein n=1 Tax=Rhodococcus opacus (strain B4) TaxID=632772 RepID=C1B7X1_RHOOB|nr:hypothetical protein ROP_35270 [Rhodococcus opacus B4]